MPAQVFSKLLYEARNPPALTAHVYTVPEGYTTVVRDVVAFINGTPGQAVGGFQLNTSVNQVVIWLLNTPYSAVGKTHHWEGRQVLVPGDGLVLTPYSAFLQIRITGYELLLP